MSVSRCHAFLHWDLLRIYLEDCNAKFGTLKLAAGAQRLVAGHRLTVQYGRTVCQFAAEKSWSLFSACFGSCTRGADKLSADRIPKPVDMSPALPSNGKHSLLVVRKQSYQRMVQKEERKRRGAKLMEDVKKLESRSSYLRELTMEETGKRRGVIRASSVLQGSRRATADFRESVRALAGDASDDPNFADCL